MFHSDVALEVLIKFNDLTRIYIKNIIHLTNKKFGKLIQTKANKGKLCLIESQFALLTEAR